MLFEANRNTLLYRERDIPAENLIRFQKIMDNVINSIYEHVYNKHICLYSHIAECIHDKENIW